MDEETAITRVAATRDMLGTVPDFFQEEGDAALRRRVEWLEREMGIRSAFFPCHLRVNEAEFHRWFNASGPLPTGRQKDLLEFWETALHLLSYVNFDKDRFKTLLERRIPPAMPEVPTGLAPPWSGDSLIDYLERHGPVALRDVNRWVTAIRFGNMYVGSESHAVPRSNQARG